MTSKIPNIRIFLSSPGDVTQERQLALEVIDHILYDPDLREKVSFSVIAWDRPGGGMVLPATMTPQAAINAQLPKPSECDIVVVIFWARMGTPLPDEYRKPDGSLFWSGTEWEYEDAIRAARQHKKPEVIVYRRTESVSFDPDAPDFDEKVIQRKRVNEFFAKFRDPKSGAILQGYNTYEKPEDFRREFEGHLKILTEKIMKEAVTHDTAAGEVKEPQVWLGSPFPGLEAFTEKQASIFFGRGREIDSLVEQVAANRFVAVVGASGSGKSSLVAAGLIPRLKKAAIQNNVTSSQDWVIVRFTPSENPYRALAEALLNALPALEGDPIEFADRVSKFGNSLQNQPDALELTIRHVLNKNGSTTEVLLFVDQFEELFTLAHKDVCDSFTTLLTKPSQKIRVVVTLRADFYHRAVELPSLAEKLRAGSFPLALPDQFALLEMIEQPAKRAALTFEQGLAKRIVQDTGNEPGALALMAYALDGLYQAGKDKRQLTFDDYQTIEGVQGAIGKRAQQTFDKLEPAVQDTITSVFRDLVEVDERGTATRQRTPLSKLARNPNSELLIKAFIQARLFVANRNPTSPYDPIIEVAHEALLRNWPRLSQWIEDVQDDLRLLRQVKNAAREWDEKGRPGAFLWQHERLQPVYEMQKRLGVEFDEVATLFVRPEAERLLEEFEQAANEKSMRTTMYRQMNIIDRFVKIGQSAIEPMILARKFASGSSKEAIEKSLRYMFDASGLDVEGIIKQHLNYGESILDILGRDKYVQSLISKLRSTDDSTRLGALQSIRDLGLGNEISLGVALEIVMTTNVGDMVKEEARRVIFEFGTPEARKLVRWDGVQNDTTLSWVERIRLVRDEKLAVAIPFLGTLLHNESATIEEKQEAILTLIMLDRFQAQQIIRSAFESFDHEVCGLVIECLSSLPSNNQNQGYLKTYFPELRRYFLSVKMPANLREKTINLFITMDTEDSANIFASLLKSRDKELKSHVTASLTKAPRSGRVYNRVRSALGETLVAIIRDENADPQLRLWACASLGDMSGPEVVHNFISLVEVFHNDPILRHQLLKSFFSTDCTFNDLKAVSKYVSAEQLRELWDSPVSKVRENAYAASTFSGVYHDESVDELAHLLINSEHINQALNIVTKLKEIRTSEAMAVIEQWRKKRGYI